MTRQVINSRPWMVLAVFCALYLAAQVLPVTRLVYSPQAVDITGQQVVLYRSFPGDALGLPRPRISYLEKVRPLTPWHNLGRPCVDEGGPFRYDLVHATGSWEMPWAEPCLSDPLGYIWEATWTWHLGLFTLGPVSLSKHVFTTPEREP
jgi:hypothetical protein